MIPIWKIQANMRHFLLRHRALIYQWGNSSVRYSVSERTARLTHIDGAMV